jgi:hypothetical protein
MASPSDASDFYTKLISHSDLYTYLCGFVGAEHPVTEKEWLEFKGCEQITPHDVKTHWSKALSAFANLKGGGVLIWGFDCRKDEYGIDKVQSLSLHPDASLHAERLVELQAQAVTSILQGVQIKAVRKPGDKGGFVICFIPEGPNKPYRAELAGMAFYLRAGRSLKAATGEEVRQLLNPTAQLAPSLTTVPKSDQTPALQFIFHLNNVGTKTARDISFRILHRPDLRFGTMHGGHDRVVVPDRLHQDIKVPLRMIMNPGASERNLFVLTHPEPKELPQFFDFTVITSCADTPMGIWKRRVVYYDYIKEKELTFSEGDAT